MRKLRFKEVKKLSQGQSFHIAKEGFKPSSLAPALALDLRAAFNTDCVLSTPVETQSVRDTKTGRDPQSYNLIGGRGGDSQINIRQRLTLASTVKNM